MSPTKASPLQALLAVARNMVPDNVVVAAVNMNVLGIITFSLFFGICLASLGSQADGMISLITVRSCLLIPLQSKGTDPSSHERSCSGAFSTTAQM